MYTYSLNQHFTYSTTYNNQKELHKFLNLFASKPLLHYKVQAVLLLDNRHIN